MPLERVLRDLAVKAQVGEVRLEVACYLRPWPWLSA